jgi:hypothetical protein
MRVIPCEPREMTGAAIGKQLRFVDESPEECGRVEVEKAFRLRSSKALSRLVPISARAE